jgi:hypothetical protein
VLAAQTAIETIHIDAHAKPAAPQPLDRHCGTSVNKNQALAINSQYLTLDGKPWLPVMGEFHYSRYPNQYWAEELEKMKAGGVQVVSTYVFWIHHEEIEGEFDWTGQRNLREFLELCKDRGLYVLLRIGPFAHGEVRNGGLPDWILEKTKPRTNDPAYLNYVRRYYAQIAGQTHGLLWKDGGPIIGVQLENEYSKTGDLAGAAHIQGLKEMARAAGLDVPLYTVTGWEHAAYPPDEVVPVFGDYPDAFWDGSLNMLPASGAYLFDLQREAPNVPYLLAEAGGGMEVAYHRRPVVSSDDVAAIAITHIGSGANLYGYYMYQGGANPQGERVSLQESAATDHVYDLPVVSYDFEAPLGEFGQERESYRKLREIHLFLHDFGSELATMPAVLPVEQPTNAADLKTLRASFRGNGKSGFLFVNNHVRDYPTAEHGAVRFSIQLANGSMIVPSAPVRIETDQYFIWPVNLTIASATLTYATAQLLCKIDAGAKSYFFFVANKGIESEFAFAADGVSSLTTSGSKKQSAGVILVRDLHAGPAEAVHFRDRDGHEASIVVLTPEQGSQLSKLALGGQEFVLLSDTTVFVDNDHLRLRSTKAGEMKFAVFPGPRVAATSVPLVPHQDGLFSEYAVPIQPSEVKVNVRQLRPAGKAAPTRPGQYNAIAPTDDDWRNAAQWAIQVEHGQAPNVDDVFLDIQYVGDVARFESGTALLDDDFYKGTDWEIGLKRFGIGTPTTLEVLPLRNDAPIFLQPELRPTIKDANGTASVIGISAHPEYQTTVQLGWH